MYNKDTSFRFNSQDIAKQIHEALGGQQKSDGSFTVHCPAHDDKNPSLNVKTSDNKLLVHCYAGCTQEAVISALKGRDLWPVNSYQKDQSDLPTGIPPTWKNKNGPDGRYSAHWEYLSAEGRILGYTVRYEKPNGKDIVPFFNCNGTKWKAGNSKAPRPLYRLNRLKKLPDLPVLICEGEKTSDAAHRLAGSDYVCITWPGGTNAVNKADWSPLASRELVVWPDADDPGFKAASTVMAQCKKAGAKSVKVVNPPANIPVGWDLADVKEWSGADVIEHINNNVATPQADSTEKLKERAEKILRDREPPEVFDLSILPPLIREYVEEICRGTDANQLTVLMAVICSMSALIGRRCYLPEGEYFNRLYPNIWAFVQAISGGFKTTSLNKGCRLAWKAEERLQVKIGFLKKEKTEISLSSLDGSAKEKKQRIKEIEQEIKDLQSESCILPNRMSGEGLLELLANGQAGLIPASELGEWLDNLAKNHNQGLKPLFTDLYDCPQQYSYKTRGGGYMIIQRPFISICGMSTPVWVQDNIRLGDVGSGFFARFLLFCPPQKRTIPPALPQVQGGMHTRAEDELKRCLDSLEDEHIFTLSPVAARHFESVHKAIYEAMEQLNENDKELLSPYTKRWSPYVLKLAMIFQVALDTNEKIGVEAIRAGAAVVEYAIKSTVYLFKGELGLSEFQRNCKKIEGYIAKKGGSADRHQVLSSRLLEGGSRDYDDALAMLEEQGKINITASETGKRKDEKISLAAEVNK